ncbi:MAG: hypothetical protein ACRDG4_12075 [Chloroflexota bacterium]
MLSPSGLRRFRRSLFLTCLCALTLISPIAVTSTDAMPAKPKAPLWGISTSLYGKTTLPGNHFTYGLRPGMVIRDAVVLHNFDSRAVRLNLYPADLRSIAGGALVPAQAYEPRRGAGAWIHLKPATVTVPAHRRVRMPFTVSVPRGVAPGDYYGSVVAASVGDNRKAGVHITTRAALIAHFSIPGRARIGVRLGSLRPRATGSGEAFSLVVTNTGNVTFGVGGAVLLRDGSGQLESTLPLGASGLYVVPGGTASLSAVWQGVPLIGRVQARAAIQIKLNGKVSRTYTSEMVSLTYFPWKPALPTLAGLIACLVIGWRSRHRLARRFRDWREDRTLLAEIRAKRRATR